MKSRDWYLSQLGLVQYIMRKPAILDGEAAITIADSTRLVIVISAPPTEKIFAAILQAISLSTEQLQFVKPQQLSMLPDSLPCPIWLIDCPAELSAALSEQALIETPDLATLSQSTHLKRQLWQTLCQYEDYFQA